MEENMDDNSEPCDCGSRYCTGPRPKGRRRTIIPRHLDGECPERDPVTEWLAWLAMCQFVGGRHAPLGASSNNAVRIALGGKDDSSRPYDSDDWGRCIMIRDCAPEPLRTRIAEVIAPWRAELIEMHRGAVCGWDSWRKADVAKLETMP
jgi:hypothetical protein